jgi:formylglycine-generating enzyme required for sulfatase activity
MAAGTAPMTLITDAATPYCMDRTEVDNQHYAAFLAGNPNTSGQIAACSGNTSFSPSGSCEGFNPGNEPSKPVTCVDWCDAFAYCQAAGKRLCGAVGGGGVTIADATTANKSEWYHACSEGGKRLYPYGNLYDTDACNGLEGNFFGKLNVGQLVSCQGGYPNLFDLSGNLREWENACGGSGCLERGGGYLDSGTAATGNTLKCTSAVVAGRLSVDKLRGFRCCADAVNQ